MWDIWLVDNYNNLIDLDKVKQSIQRRGPDQQGQWFSENKKLNSYTQDYPYWIYQKMQPTMSSNGKFIITYMGKFIIFINLKNRK